MQHGGAGVEVLLSTRQQPGHQQVDRQTDGGGDGDRFAHYRLRRLQALDGGHCQPAHQHQQAETVDQRGDELGTAQSVAVAQRGWALCQPGRAGRE